jgi:DNA primase
MEYRDEVVSILSEYIKFQKHQSSSENYAAYCPFHKGGKEAKPSFYVYVGTPTRNKSPGASFCHTCAEGWSFTGLLKKLSVPNPIIDGVRKHLDDICPEQEKIQKLEFRWDILPEAILGMFSYIPKKLLSTGFAESILREYEIGFDRGRKRIIFPIRNHLGELVALSGRTVKDEWPRYKIYKNELTEVIPNYSFDKKTVLWGLDRFYETRMYTDTNLDMPVVVCEGFKAALWVIQSGYTHTVAILGSYLSREQEALLTRVTNRVVLFLDNDDAGRKAVNKISENQLRGLDVRIANYRANSNDRSPDDLSQTEVQAAIETALTPITWRRSNEYDRLQ